MTILHTDCPFTIGNIDDITNKTICLSLCKICIKFIQKWKTFKRFQIDTERSRDEEAIHHLFYLREGQENSLFLNIYNWF